jgi:hypothetical protein
MIRSHWTSLAASLAAFAVLAVFTSESNAALTLRLDDNAGNVVTITDEVAGDVALGTPGSVSFVGGVGVFTLNITVANSYPVSGTATDPDMTLTVSQITNSAGGQLTITMTHENFGPTSVQWQKVLNSANDGGLITFDGFVDNGNALFATTTPVGGQLSGVGAFNTFDFPVVATDGEYSITAIANVFLSGPNQARNFDAQIGAGSGAFLTPEPGSMLVWGLGMGLVAAGGYWRRRKVTA